MTTSNSKVYLEIVKQIRSIIEEDKLQPGDRLPSERELSARLNVGRSSVREALRSLELVGLIETRRGEGTFVRNFYEHSLVQLIATFVLQDNKTKQDLLQMKALVEKEALRMLCKVDKLEITFVRNSESISSFHHAFFKEIFKKTENYLLYRVWLILNDYVSTLSYDINLEDQTLYNKLSTSLQNQDEEEALRLYEAITERIVFHS
ncbi:FadR/GntR family transcriptional regulator [Microbacteriaceae bacterium 4G12]